MDSPRHAETAVYATTESLAVPASTMINPVTELPSTTTITMGAPMTNPRLNGKTGELIHHFRMLLEPYESLDYGRQLNPADAFFAFRLLLGRNPDLTHELPGILTNTHTFREFLSDLLNSEDLSHCVGFMPPNRVFMAQLENFRVWFNTSDREMGMIMAAGQYEPKSVALLKRIIAPGMKCIDAGAHIGFYTCLLAHLVGECGKVYSFEPMPSNFELLVKNINENQIQQRVYAYQLACSDNSGIMTASKVSNMYVIGQVSDAEQVNLEAVRMDDIVKEAIDIVKLDVEGHEPSAIRGMVSILSKDKPIILSEINEYWLRTCSNSSATEYIDLLKSFAYDVFDVKNLDHPISNGSLELDILDTLDVVALPFGYNL